jgi:hypothetical protein
VIGNAASITAGAKLASIAMLTRDKSLVQAVELWLPQGEVLALGQGTYRGQPELLAAGTGQAFHYGEGLPGAVWASGRPLLWREQAAPFVRPELAERGVDAMLGLPLFEGDRLVAVVVLLLGSSTESPGCLEVWNVADDLDVLKLGSGYYLHCSELERFSPHIQFQRGTGLPGLTWLSGEVQVMQDLRRSNAFIRAGLAARSGLKHGVGIPVYRERRLAHVVALLAAEHKSFVSSVELYHPRQRELGAAVLFDFNGRGSLPGESAAEAPGRRLAERVLQSGLPSLEEARLPNGHQITLAFPLHDRKGVKQIVVLRF